jgi:ABC-type nitrate/sulfonate/bicarbonate transport system permease component
METSERRSAKQSVDNPLNTKLRGDSIGSKSGSWVALAIVFFVLLAWETASRSGVLSRLFFPAPSAISVALLHDISNGTLKTNMALTLSRVFSGFLIGGMAGLILGLAMGWSRRVRGVLDPFVAAGHPVPKIALLPLFMILFGVGETSKVVVIAIAAFFPMLINSMAGVRQIHPEHFQVAQNYNAGKLKIFLRVVLPGSLPLVISGMRLSINYALLITIAVEIMAARSGLGAMIWLAWETLRVEELYVSIFITALIGICVNALLLSLAKRLIPWQAQ